MFGLNLTSDFHKESKKSLRDSLALGFGALSARFDGSSGRGLILAAALCAGVIGGLVPTVLKAALHRSADAASLSRTVDKVEKLESEQTADAATVGSIAQANALLQARVDTLEKRLAKVEKANLDMTPSGAIASPDHTALRSDNKHKQPKN